MPLVALAVAAVVLGVVVEPVRVALNAAGQPSPTLVEALVSGLLAVAVVVAVLLPVRASLLTIRCFPTCRASCGSRTRVRLLREWLGLERLAVRAVAAPTMALARMLSVFDERVVDGAVWAVAATGRAAARLADLRVESLVSGAVRGVGAGVRALGRLARRPQTGQLHQYYAQAACALAVLALVPGPGEVRRAHCDRVLAAGRRAGAAGGAPATGPGRAVDVGRGQRSGPRAGRRGVGRLRPRAGYRLRGERAVDPTVSSGYHVGVDGLSLPLVAMTAACSSWPARSTRCASGSRCAAYVAAVPVPADGVSSGLFVALDLILFFVFFDLSIVAMYFVIAGWGHGERRRRRR